MSITRLMPCTALLIALAAAPVLAQTTSDNAASASEPAAKKPAKAGVQSGKASGAGAASGQTVEGTGGRHDTGHQEARQTRRAIGQGVRAALRFHPASIGWAGAPSDGINGAALASAIHTANGNARATCRGARSCSKRASASSGSPCSTHTP